jgi:hypothetical protein
MPLGMIKETKKDWSSISHHFLVYDGGDDNSLGDSTSIIKKITEALLDAAS